jgi:spore coat polysaccharide biosynthesis protein SpsF (cytidylyltransferase family)/2-polyprenyl-3-methyl-5-hydroxy-6-metoxy-1,4-benzoquinol methylase
MTILVIQCRLGSTRLPGKALYTLKNKALISWTMDAMKKVEADEYYVATDEKSADKLTPLVKNAGYELFIGSELDVLDRFCSLIEKTGSDIVIRVTGDNPFLFIDVASMLLVEFKNRNCDYITWTGLPHGSGIEIFSGSALLTARKETEDPYDHEHVGPALYNHQDKFTSLFLPAPSQWNYPTLRTTIDTKDDYEKALRMSWYLDNADSLSSESIISLAKKISVEKKIILCPSMKKGHGTGHLRRMLQVASHIPAYVFIPLTSDLEAGKQLINEYLEQKEIEPWQIIDTLVSEKADLVVTDAFALTKDEAQLYSSIGPLISIDEGSSNTLYCDFLLDIIPSAGYNRQENVFKTNFLPLPEIRKENYPKEIKKVLIAIGGEDPSGLTLPAVRAFQSLNLEVTALYSKEIPDLKQYESVTFVPFIHNLGEEIHTYDLVVTHYGFTAFESVAAKCFVLLLGTSPLHIQLSKKYGFTCLSESELIPDRIRDILSNTELLIPSKTIQESVSQQKENLWEYIEKLSLGKKRSCPKCVNLSHSHFDKVISRDEQKTIRRCKNCNLDYISWNTEKEKQYTQSYFFEEYTNQYGKTYLEDFQHIKKEGIRRIKNINSVVHKKGSILDIGCAYGPFLSAAKDCGWVPYGTDISSDAIQYVTQELGFSACTSSFPSNDMEEKLSKNNFDAVTMWYVIEHFQNLHDVLTKVSNLVSRGGIFAFSTPNSKGISGKTNPKQFYRQSPSDHYTIWCPKTAKKLLTMYGFKVKKIVITGHHPERFKSHPKKGSILFKLLEIVSRIGKLGDTFEVYCVKE